MLSKNQKKPEKLHEHAQPRMMWAINPRTQVKQDKKKYNRAKEKARFSKNEW